MKYLFLGLLLSISLITIAQDFKGMPTGDEKISSSNESFEQELLTLVNKERAKRRRKPLVLNESLTNAARYHAMDMAVDSYFEHDSKDQRKNGSHKKICSVFERMDRFVKEGVFAKSENIAVGNQSPEEVMRAWMLSKGHRVNILDKDTKYIGLAYIYVEGSKWGGHWVQCFGM
ncbi:MAG: Secretion protein [uncultured Aureispira sp.]|uniref:Secretion protein n=1 Tax=uncultured Aureispira sp. TaxID=1331704 RepID=A0A6S6U6I9_9BACT|nr:MAG: Secretion protein [uncultured Aureispira sp.]